MVNDRVNAMVNHRVQEIFLLDDNRTSLVTGMNSTNPLSACLASAGDPNSAPRCGARTRKGTPCRGPAMTNGRCRMMHGGKSTGPQTHEGLECSRKANWKHGYYSAESIAMCRYIIRLLCERRDLMNDLTSPRIKI